MSTEPTFLIHDYETWGVDPMRDRAAQFAALRVDQDLNPIADPINITCRLSRDYIPSPRAAAVTGLSPQATETGLSEPEFFQRIHAELMKPGTCSCGYNSLVYDDVISRFGFWRNFIPPYAHGFGQNRSRWDILPLVRAAYAFRPEGLQWPVREDGQPSFRLEDLAAANGLAHDAHDALGDVRATLAILRLLREHQPKLVDYALTLRNKNRIRRLLEPRAPGFVLQVSAHTPARQRHLTALALLGPHPRSAGKPADKWSSVIAYDLRQDPQELIDMPADAIRERLFASGMASFGLREIAFNKCPFIVRTENPNPDMLEQAELDLETIRARQAQLAEPSIRQAVQAKLAEIYDTEMPPAGDPDVALYDGFISPKDAGTCAAIRQSEPAKLASYAQQLDDPRLKTLLFRYRARNWPETLSDEEQAQWQEFRRSRVLEGADGFLSADAAKAQDAEIAAETLSERQRQAVKDTLIWIEGLKFELM